MFNDGRVPPRKCKQMEGIDVSLIRNSLRESGVTPIRHLAGLIWSGCARLQTRCSGGRRSRSATCWSGAPCGARSWQWWGPPRCIRPLLCVQTLTTFNACVFNCFSATERDSFLAPATFSLLHAQVMLGKMSVLKGMAHGGFRSWLHVICGEHLFVEMCCVSAHDFMLLAESGKYHFCLLFMQDARTKTE